MAIPLALGLVVVAAVLGWAHRQDRRRTLPRGALAVFAAGAIALTLYTFTRPIGTISGDEGIKLAQAAALAEGQIALTYPGEELDPGHRYFPLRAPYVVVEDGRHYGVYSIVFTAPSAIGWRLFGYWGLHVLPLLGGLLSLWYTMVLAQRALGSTRWTIAAGVAMASTPVWLNATLFNEHALSCGLVLLALVHASAPDPRRAALIASGAALGVAVAIRPELITGIPALALFAGVLARGPRDAARRIGWMLLGGAGPLAVYVVANLLTVHVPSQVMHRDFEPIKWRMRGRDLYPADLERLTGVHGWYLFAPFALALIPPLPWRAVERWRAPLAAALAAGWLVVCARYLRAITGAPHQMPWALFVGTPGFVLGLMCGPYRLTARRGADGGERDGGERDGGDGHGGERDGGERLTRALWLLVIVGLAAMAWINSSMGHGARLGARFILPYLPPLLIGSLAVAQRSRLLLGVGALAFALGLWAQALNHDAAMRLRSRDAALVRDIRSRPERCSFSGLFWGPQIAAPVWNEKQLFLGGPHIGPILREIKRRGDPGVLEVVGGVREWVKLDQEPRLELVPSAAGESPYVQVYRFVP